MSKTLLVVDSDTIAYAAAAVCEKRTVEVTHLKSGKVKTFDNRTGFKDYLLQKDYPFVKEEYSFKDIQEPQSLKNLYRLLKHRLGVMQDTWWPDKTILYVSGKDNFRNSLPLPTRYKVNRSANLRPVLLDKAKEYLVHKGAVRTHGEEPDDAIVYTAYEYQNKGWNVVVGCYEKDSRCLSGLTLWDYTQNTSDTFLVPSFGELRYDTEKRNVKGEGFIWYCFQHLRGDISDGYYPYELTGKRFGDKGAFDLLKSCKNEQEALTVLINQFKTWYPEPFAYKAWDGKEIHADYKFILDLYFKACRMKEKKDDPLDFNAFIKQYNVEY